MIPMALNGCVRGCPIIDSQTLGNSYKEIWSVKSDATCDLKTFLIENATVTQIPKWKVDVHTEVNVEDVVLFTR